MRQVLENVKLRDDTKIGLDCGYSDGDNLKFAEDNELDLYVPSRAQAQEFDGKNQTLNHDNYEYDSETNELIVDGARYNYRGFYYRKDGKRKEVFYSKDLKKKKEIPQFFRERLRMRDKMAKPEGRKIYNRRKITVEPIYGNLKQNFGMREFLLRGLEKVRIEMNLVCIAYNLQKIWKMRANVG